MQGLFFAGGFVWEANMSADDEAAVIGRMVMERNQLSQRRTVLDEAIHDYAIRLKSIGLQLEHAGPDEVTLLGGPEFQVMESGQKINALLTERSEVRRRHIELDNKLRTLGA